MGLTTTVGPARPKSESLRVTLPMGIAQFLQVKAGDELDWEMKTEGDVRSVVVRKV